MPYTFQVDTYQKQLVPLLKKIEQSATLTARKLAKLVNAHPKPEGGVFSKDQLIAGYRLLAGSHGLQPYSEEIIKQLQMKPSRTQSGVATVTVLTKPFPCPGKCIFCPNDIRMPKSYLADEPGAQRAERNFFDPYLQTYNRLQALHNIGHSIDKVEVIVLGGTWSFYPEKYQIWFITKIFEALNDFGSTDQRPEILNIYDTLTTNYQKLAKTRPIYVPSSDPATNYSNLRNKRITGENLEKTYNQVISETYVAPEKLTGADTYQEATWSELSTQHQLNEHAATRCVGLVVETRPDNISQTEIIRMRKLGCTKTQIGLQSIQDEVLLKNKRGHDVQASRRAIALLRQAGFKIHAHWMANLYGSSVQADMAEYKTLFEDPDFCPDELKVYPCSLIGSAELMQYHKKGLWKPYSYSELLEVLTFVLRHTPPYCRLTRIIRDIPSTDIVAGNTYTNFRQIAEQSLEKVGESSQDIRAREIGINSWKWADATYSYLTYPTSVSTEYFLQYTVPVTKQGKQQEKLLAFLRLSIPHAPAWIPELSDSAIIREIHVYGKVSTIGEKNPHTPQHVGLGTKLIAHAQTIARKHDYTKLAVISAIGTREYYRKKGFSDGELYQYISTTS